MNHLTFTIHRPLARIAGLVLLAAGMASCSKQLNPLPHDRIDEKTALSSPQQVRNLLNNAYAMLTNGGLYGQHQLQQQDFQGMDLYPAHRLDLFLYTLTPSSPNFTNLPITVSYSGILTCNRIIGEKSGDALYNGLVGEAHFVRALLYLDLCRNYAYPYTNIAARPTAPGTGMPLVLSAQAVADRPVDFRPARNTLAETCAQILADLQKARELCPDAQPGTSDIYYASKDAAEALLSRYYLYTGNWAAAATAASAVIKSGRYTLWQGAAIKSAFTTRLSSEEIFSLPFNQGEADNGTFLREYNPQTTQVSLTNNWLALLSDADARKVYVTAVNGISRLAKFEQAPGVVFMDVKVLRLAETYLNRAEAYAEQNMLAEALADVNTLRSHRGLPNFSAATKKAVLEEIARQRRLELVGEGFARFDIFRKNLVREVITVNGATFPQEAIQPDDYRIVLPIPQAELLVNPHMQQNPGYGI